MIDRSQNPFLSRANSNRLKDDEIHSLWVGLDETIAQHPIFDPKSPLPTIVLGGKGSGKTHLFRYHSFPVQGLKYGEAGEENWGSALERDGYIGIYTRADGLSSSRFVGKGVNEEQWHTVFKHYVELWLAQGLLDVCASLVDHVPEIRAAETDIVRKARLLIDSTETEGAAVSFVELGEILRYMHHEIDRQVNAAAFERSISPSIGFSPGDLIFGLPAILSDGVELLKDVLYCYYIDECENLTESQQQYLNTLVREARPSVTFRIGVRSYGMWSYRTDSGHGEEIAEGSEYQRIALDARFRAADEASYQKFTRALLERRLERSDSPLFVLGGNVNSYFPSLEFAMAGRGQERSRRLEGLDRDLKGFVRNPSDVVAALSWPNDDLLQRAGLFLFFQGFSKGEKDLYSLALRIRRGLEGTDMDIRRELSSAIGHYKNDFLAQIDREMKGPSRIGSEYTGLQAFVTMSEGLPRSLLTIVGNVIHSAAYHGEVPVAPSGVSLRPQLDGVREAAERFFGDLPKAGTHSDRIWKAINRLGQLFRLSRFADKPTECSLVAFSVSLERASQDTRDLIDEAEKRSFLVRSAKPQKDRSSHEVWEKFNLNRVLCPRYDLPISIRGRARFSVAEADAIFGQDDDQAFKGVIAEWNGRLNWPFGRPKVLKEGTLF